MLTTYSLNGIDLSSNSYGWTLSSDSKPRPGISMRAVTLVVGGFDGNIPVPMSEDPPLLTLSMRVPDTTNETFLVLCDSALTLTHDSYSASVELLSIVPVQHVVDFTDYDILLRFSGMFWRDPSVTTSAAVTLTTNSQVTTCLAGLSAPVRDAIVRITGGTATVQVTDSLGSFFSYPVALPSTSWLRFEAATGRAFTTTTNVWTGGTEVTGSIVNGPGPYPLQLTPNFTDPATRVASLTVASTTRTGTPAIEVRAARAFRI